MVIFCTKSTDTPLRFRKPDEKDFLQSYARKQSLEPKHEVLAPQLLDQHFDDDKGTPLRRNNTGKMARWHGVSAAGHWEVMRHVLPATIWEGW